MKEPTYKPEQWIVYQQGDEGGFGQIVGGMFDENGWSYTISGSDNSGTLSMVAQDDITHLLQNGSWLAPSHFGGQASVYSEQEA